MSDQWRNSYDRWRLASPPEDDPVPLECFHDQGCGGRFSSEDVDVDDGCPECGKGLREVDVDAEREDAAIERAEAAREATMFDRDSWEER